MKASDASSIIYAWDNYPIDQFPPLWGWLGTEVTAGNIVMATVAFEEVEHKLPECASWLSDFNITLLPIEERHARDALAMKTALGIVGEQYADGVGENDLFIIAVARAHRLPLVNNENRQPILPTTRRKYKIPAVCDMGHEPVVHMNFLEFLKSSKIVFGN